MPVRLDLTLDRAELFDLRHKSWFTVRYRTLVGADGAYSATRRLVTGRPLRVCPAFQYTCDCTQDMHALEPHLHDERDGFALGLIRACWQ